MLYMADNCVGVGEEVGSLDTGGGIDFDDEKIVVFLIESDVNSSEV